MKAAVLIELFGYLGSTLVVVSMLMASVVKLRVINCIGSVISATYAFIIGSFPLALMNICLIIINLYNLYKLLKSDRHFDLVEGTEDDAFLSYFLERNQKDIVRYFPEFQVDEATFNKAYLVCCNGDPAGVILGQLNENGEFDVKLDYSVPAYRDCSVGKYLYAQLGGKGVRKLHFAGGSESHIDYLTKMGFVEENGVYHKELY